MDRVVLKPFCKDKFELVESYSYECGFGAVNVPKGYITNGADIPRLFWSFYPPNSPEYLSAVVIHDYLCDEARKKVVDKYKAYQKADKVFYTALTELGVSRYKAWLFYKSCYLYHATKNILGRYKDDK